MRARRCASPKSTTSIALMQRVLLLLPDGTGARRMRAGAEVGGTRLERVAARLAVLRGAFRRDGRLARVKIKSPSFSNWRVFPFTVHDSNMMDYAINEASFGLTIAGCDR